MAQLADRIETGLGRGIGFLKTILWGVLIFTGAVLVASWVVPKLFGLFFAAAILGGLGWLGYQLFLQLQRFGEAAGEEHTLRVKLASVEKLDARNVGSFLAGGSLKAPEDADWPAVAGYTKGLTDLTSFLSKEREGEFRASLNRKSQPLLAQVVGEVRELKKCLAKDLELREEATVLAEAEKARAEESAQRLMLETEKTRKATVEQELRREEARARALALEREKKLGAYGLSEHLDGLLRILSEVKEGELSDQEEARLVEGYRKLREQVDRHSAVPLTERDAIGPDDLRLVQVRAILRRYAEEISRVESDESLDPALKDVVVGVWKGLMDQDVIGIGGKS